MTGPWEVAPGATLAPADETAVLSASHVNGLQFLGGNESWQAGLVPMSQGDGTVKWVPPPATPLGTNIDEGTF